MIRSHGSVIVGKLFDMRKTKVWLAEQVGVPRQVLNGILHDARPGRKHRLAIAKALGMQYEDVWDD